MLSAVATNSGESQSTASGLATNSTRQGQRFSAARHSMMIFRRPLLETGRSKSQTHSETPHSAARLPRIFTRRQRFGHFAVAAVHARHVAVSAVAGEEDHAAAQSGLDGREHVVTVQPKRAMDERRPLDFAPPPLFACRGAARTSGRGHPLPADQRVTVADQFQRGVGRIALAQQPAEIIDRTRQDRPSPGTKQPGVLGMRSAMHSFVGQKVTWNFSHTRQGGCARDKPPGPAR